MQRLFRSRLLGRCVRHLSRTLSRQRTPLAWSRSAQWTMHRHWSFPSVNHHRGFAYRRHYHPKKAQTRRQKLHAALQARYGDIFNFRWRIAILGCPNVGKSSLFNKLSTGGEGGFDSGGASLNAPLRRHSRRNAAFVHKTAGVTRDRTVNSGHLGYLNFEICDTAGLERVGQFLADNELRTIRGEGLNEETQRGILAQTERAIEEADIVLYMYDVREGVTPVDKSFAQWVLSRRQEGQPVIAVANKCEHNTSDSILHTGLADGLQLGMGEPVPISAIHGDGLADLHNALALSFRDAIPLKMRALGRQRQRELHLQALRDTVYHTPDAPREMTWYDYRMLMDCVNNNLSRFKAPSQTHTSSLTQTTDDPALTRRADVQSDGDGEVIADLFPNHHTTHEDFHALDFSTYSSAMPTWIAERFQTAYLTRCEQRELDPMRPDFNREIEETVRKQIPVWELDQMSRKQRMKAVTGDQHTLAREFSFRGDTFPAPTTPWTPREVHMCVLGRPNSGKSTLLNQLVCDDRSVVGPQAGITRDNVAARFRYDLEFPRTEFRLVDTAGLTGVSPTSLNAENRLDQHAMQRSLAAIQAADVCVLCVDPTTQLRGAIGDRAQLDDLNEGGRVDIVHQLLAQLHEGDNAKQSQSRLSLGELAALAGGPTDFADIPNLSEEAKEIISQAKEREDKRKQRKYRRMTSHRGGKGLESVPSLPFDNVLRPVSAEGSDAGSHIERFDFVDATSKDLAGDLQQQERVVTLIQDAVARTDLRIASEALKHGKCVVVVVNKMDLIPRSMQRAVYEGLRWVFQRSLNQTKGVPVIPLSGQSGTNVPHLLRCAVSHYDRWSYRVNTGLLNQWVQEYARVNPPPAGKSVSHSKRQGRYAHATQVRPTRIRYITQTSVRPPNFVVFANRVKGIPNSYVKGLQNALQEEFHFEGVPIRVHLRAGKNPYSK